MPDRVDFAAEVRSLRETLLPEPRMIRTLPCLFAALALAACGAEESPSPSYAFIGTWDCGATTLAFTNSTFADGQNSYPIRAVSQDGRNYTVRYGNFDIMVLAEVTQTGLTRVSGTSGPQLNCRRVG
jgi:hypothetical protein